jgi:hypothetical protein
MLCRWRSPPAPPTRAGSSGRPSAAQRRGGFSSGCGAAGRPGGASTEESTRTARVAESFGPPMFSESDGKGGGSGPGPGGLRADSTGTVAGASG